MKKFIVAVVCALIPILGMAGQEEIVPIVYCPNQVTSLSMEANGTLHVSVYEGADFSSEEADAKAVSAWVEMLLQARQQKTSVFIYYMLPERRITRMALASSTEKCKPIDYPRH